MSEKQIEKENENENEQITQSAQTQSSLVPNWVLVTGAILLIGGTVALGLIGFFLRIMFLKRSADVLKLASAQQQQKQ